MTNALATEGPALIDGIRQRRHRHHLPDPGALVYGAVAFAISWRASLAAIVAGVVVIGLSHFLVKLTRKAGKRQTRLMAS